MSSIQGTVPTPATKPLADEAFPWPVQWLARDKTPTHRLVAHDRALYLALGGTGGEGLAPDVAVIGPEGITPPIQELPVWEGDRGLWTIRLRFLEPSDGYRVVDRSIPSAPSIPVPEVGPSEAQLEGLKLTMTASPPVTGPEVPVSLTFAVTGPASVPRDYQIRVINPCGWGPEATRSVLSLPATFSMVLPAEEIIYVTGNYTIRIADMSGNKTWAKSAKATFTYLTR
ncbi:MAG: hypothetical protein VKO21_12550 [Candidatus Sericytochromatia bacterium]|nr:hypothetical protein [Candidatus Sericytochromatia bacterium]